MTLHKHTFDWSKFKGGKDALKWNMRELASIDAVLKVVPGRTACVQGGGNLGIFAKYLARFFDTVYTFEPAPELFPVMTSNASERNVVRLQAALGETPGLVGTVCARRGAKQLPAHEGLTHVAGEGYIPTVRLDDLALPLVDLIYLDLEGFEMYALRGARETIHRCRPVIAVEINQNCEFYGVQRDDVRDWLRAQRYTLAFRIHSDEVYIPCP